MTLSLGTDPLPHPVTFCSILPADLTDGSALRSMNVYEANTWWVVGLLQGCISSRQPLLIQHTGFHGPLSPGLVFFFPNLKKKKSPLMVVRCFHATFLLWEERLCEGWLSVLGSSRFSKFTLLLKSILAPSCSEAIAYVYLCFTPRNNGTISSV